MNWNNFDYVLKQVKNNGCKLAKALKELKDNNVIVSDAVENICIN